MKGPPHYTMRLLAERRQTSEEVQDGRPQPCTEHGETSRGNRKSGREADLLLEHAAPSGEQGREGLDPASDTGKTQPIVEVVGSSPPAHR